VRLVVEQNGRNAMRSAKVESGTTAATSAHNRDPKRPG
jgi:hypothetical protein